MRVRELHLNGAFAPKQDTAEAGCPQGGDSARTAKNPVRSGMGRHGIFKESGRDQTPSEFG